MDIKIVGHKEAPERKCREHARQKRKRKKGRGESEEEKGRGGAAIMLKWNHEKNIH